MSGKAQPIMRCVARKTSTMSVMPIHRSSEVGSPERSISSCSNTH